MCVHKTCRIFHFSSHAHVGPAAFNISLNFLWYAAHTEYVFLPFEGKLKTIFSPESKSCQACPEPGRTVWRWKCGWWLLVSRRSRSHLSSLGLVTSDLRFHRFFNSQHFLQWMRDLNDDSSMIWLTEGRGVWWDGEIEGKPKGKFLDFSQASGRDTTLVWFDWHEVLYRHSWFQEDESDWFWQSPHFSSSATNRSKFLLIHSNISSYTCFLTLNPDSSCSLIVSLSESKTLRSQNDETVCLSLPFPSALPSQNEATQMSESLGRQQTFQDFFLFPLSGCSLTRWEMRLEMIWGRAGFRPLFQNPSAGPFELAVQGRLIQPLQRRWRPRLTSGLRWPLTRSLHEWKQRGMSSNLSPAERGFQVRPGVFPLWLGEEKMLAGFPAGKWHPAFCRLKDPMERSYKSLRFT